MDVSKMTDKELKELKEPLLKKLIITAVVFVISYVWFISTDSPEGMFFPGLACVGSVIYVFIPLRKFAPINNELRKRALDTFQQTLQSVVPAGCQTTVTVLGTNIADSKAFGLKKNMIYYMWKDNDKLKLFPIGGKMEAGDSPLKAIALKNILYYELDGELYHETKISGGGGSRTSIPGAMIGKAVGGTVGALLLGNKGPKSIQSRDITHDTRAVYLRLPNQIYIKFAYTDLNVFKMVIPEKDVAAINSQPQTQPVQEINSSAADEIVKYKKLFDDGIITEDEFNAKKKQLLGL